MRSFALHRRIIQSSASGITTNKLVASILDLFLADSNTIALCLIGRDAFLLV